jgi:hypothetical protein
MNVQILPLAITMVAGPQIMSSIIFVTAEHAVKLSMAYIAGAAIGVVGGLLLAYGLISALGISLGDSSEQGSAGKIIQFALIALLVAGIVKNYRGRETIEPPKWLSGLMAMEPRKAFVLGALLLSIFPSDALILLTVATNLHQNDASVIEALPFVGLTVLFVALPFLAFLLFHRRAIKAMPKVRDWMTTNSWLVNIIVCGIFIVLIL